MAAWFLGLLVATLPVEGLRGQERAKQVTNSPKPTVIKAQDDAKPVQKLPDFSPKVDDAHGRNSVSENYSGTENKSGSKGHLRQFELRWFEDADPVSKFSSGPKWTFSGAFIPSNGSQLPHLYTYVGPQPEGQSTMAVISRPIYEAFLPGQWAMPREVEQHVGPEPEVRQVHFYEQKQRCLAFEILPLRKNVQTGQLERLVAFDLQLQPVAYSGPRAGVAGANSFAGHSVLASGDWYKIEVAADGIYRLTYADLQALGVDVASIDPRKISIFGNGGGMKPTLNSTPRHDDLVENAIVVLGEGDGRFDQDDKVLFYAEGPHRWVVDNTSCKPFRHLYNIYAEKASLFLHIGSANGKRVQTQGNADGQETVTVTSFNGREFRESDQRNLIKSGRNWVGETFDLQTSYSFDLSFPNVLSSEPAYVSTRLLSKSLGSAVNYSIRVNGVNLSTVSIPSGTGGVYDSFARDQTVCLETSIANPSTSITLTYNKTSNPSAVGWLDWLEVHARRQLRFTQGQMMFRDLTSVGPASIARFELSNASGSVKVWDVTDQTEVIERSLSFSGQTAWFKAQADTLREYLAFDGTSWLTPELKGRVENQDLHAMPQVNMVIVAAPELLSEAERLAQFHRNNEKNPLTVAVVTPQQVYNEFSSGQQDIVAIRDLMRMLYERATSANQMPRYLLMFGDASYDYKDRISANTNLVPTYQSDESLSITGSHCSDDFFGALDPSEGNFNNDALDIGIGRFPVTTLEQAKGIVDKIYRYEQITANSFGTGAVCGDAGVNIGAPNWRNTFVFVGDDEDQDLHMKQADQLATQVDTTYSEYDIKKIYLDSYVQISTPGGQRYPEANRDINLAVQKGALIINYTGHGGELGLTHERVLGVSDINAWTNIDNLPAFVTATCEFSRYDDPERISAGEYVLLNPNGGGIALFTTSRLVYAAPNFTLNQNFYRKLQTPQPWGLPTMGDVIRMTKVLSGFAPNNRNFVLLGDPAQRLSYPEHNIETTYINAPLGSQPDTVRALQLVTVKGRVRKSDGNLFSDFNGIVYPTVFDKPDSVLCLRNDPQNSSPGGFKFQVQRNLIYAGKATVKDGEFEFSFVVPRDIAYKFGPGRISYYAEGNNTNAHGRNNMIVVGGSLLGSVTDNEGPGLRLFMNDEKFVFGGTTDPSPVLLAFLTDSNGINTVGSGIGHDITAVVDGNSGNTISLNDYYQADLDSYRSGRVAYPFKDLSEGRHTLRLKAWDVHNNSSEGYLEFVVAGTAQLALQHVLNYPNPFSTKTSFFFEHNRPCGNLNVTVQVFTISGKLVKTIHEQMVCNGYRSNPIDWDGRDDFGQNIGRGVYVYSLRVHTDEGLTASHLDKLVILN